MYLTHMTCRGVRLPWNSCIVLLAKHNFIGKEQFYWQSAVLLAKRGSAKLCWPATALITTCLLTHFILNRLSHTIYWKSPISILGMSGYIVYIFLEKKTKLFANSGDPDQMPRHLIWVCTVCQLPFSGIQKTMG